MVNIPYIILQAKMNSERLPGKVMREIGGKPIIGAGPFRLIVASHLSYRFVERSAMRMGRSILDRKRPRTVPADPEQPL